jgi:hypothetical protein
MACRCHRETADRARGLLPDYIVSAARAGQAIEAELDRPLTAKEGDTLFPALLKLRQVCNWQSVVMRTTAVHAAGLKHRPSCNC